MTEQQQSSPPREGLRDEGGRDDGVRDDGARDDGRHHDDRGGDRDRGNGGVGGTSGSGGAAPGSYSQAHGDGAGTGGNQEQHVRVLDERRSEDLRNRWNQVQTGFVDEPRQAVTDADQLVGEVLDEVSRAFREQRADLEKGWGDHNEPGTEDLRQALFRYREFFDRLLSL